MFLGLAVPAVRQVEAGTEISVDFFYDNLGTDGSWVQLPQAPLVYQLW